MAKLVPETRSARKLPGGGAVIHEAAPGGAKKMRCPATLQLATPVTLPGGQQGLRTPAGTTYVTRKLK